MQGIVFVTQLQELLARPASLLRFDPPRTVGRNYLVRHRAFVEKPLQAIHGFRPRCRSTYESLRIHIGSWHEAWVESCRCRTGSEPGSYTSVEVCPLARKGC